MHQVFVLFSHSSDMDSSGSESVISESSNVSSRSNSRLGDSNVMSHGRTHNRRKRRVCFLINHIECDVMWCVVLCCGVVGVLWCGVVWCGLVWCGVVGVVWCDVVWCGVVWWVWCGVVWYVVLCCVVICCELLSCLDELTKLTVIILRINLFPRSQCEELPRKWSKYRKQQWKEDSLQQSISF